MTVIRAHVAVYIEIALSKQIIGLLNTAELPSRLSTEK